MLAVGMLVYMADRDPVHAALFPTIAALHGGAVFGVLGAWLPSFVHPFAFSLFTAAALPAHLGWRLAACVSWGAVNVAFEVGQHPHVSASLADWLQSGDAPTWPAQALSNYFLRGTFDVADIGAALLGAAAAAGVLCWMRGPLEKHHAS
jgi:hypothetical protein